MPKVYSSLEVCQFVSRICLLYLTFVFSTCTGDNGTLTFWDYNTGTPFQNLDDVPQPGSLEAEAGVFCSTFDMTGTRLITGGADKTIKASFTIFPLFPTTDLRNLSVHILGLRGAITINNGYIGDCTTIYTFFAAVSYFLTL